MLLRLLADADVFVESSKGGTWAKKGLTDEVLWAVNPRLVIVHVSGFGQTGVPEMVSRAAYDLTVMAYSGYLSQNGTPEQPMNPGPYAGDYFNSLMILELDAGRPAQGEPDREGRVHRRRHVRDPAGHRAVLPGRLPERRRGLAAARRAQPEPVRDRRVQVRRRLHRPVRLRRPAEQVPAGDDRARRTSGGTDDYPEDTSGLWLSSPQSALIEAKLEEYLATRNVADVEADFAAHRIAAQKVMEMPDLVEEEHLRQRGVWLDWQTAEGEQFKGLGVFPRFGQHPGQVWRPMPDQGADSRDVLTRLGYSAAEITALIATGVVKQSI